MILGFDSLAAQVMGRLRGALPALTDLSSLELNPVFPGYFV